METLSKKPRKDKQIVVRLTNYENLSLKLELGIVVSNLLNSLNSQINLWK